MDRRAASERSPRRRRGGWSRSRACRLGGIGACRTVSAGWFGAYYSPGWQPFRPGPSGAGRVPARSSDRSTAASTEEPGCSSACLCSWPRSASRGRRRCRGHSCPPSTAQRRSSSRQNLVEEQLEPAAGRARSGPTGSVSQLQPYGLPIRTERFSAVIPGPRTSRNAESRRGGRRTLARDDRRDGAPRQRRERPGRERQRVGHGDARPARACVRRAGRRLLRTPAPEPHDPLRLDRRRFRRRSRRCLVRRRTRRYAATSPG